MIISKDFKIAFLSMCLQLTIAPFYNFKFTVKNALYIPVVENEVVDLIRKLQQFESSERDKKLRNVDVDTYDLFIGRPEGS